jgi:hypothetical protein
MPLSPDIESEYYVLLRGNHLKVSRHDKRDGITWDTLQRIKNEMCGEEATAVEFYPPVSQLHYVGNFRHLWIVDGVPVECNLSGGKTRGNV